MGLAGLGPGSALGLALGGLLHTDRLDISKGVIWSGSPEETSQAGQAVDVDR